jgi:DNA-binding transcriptional MerR regulator
MVDQADGAQGLTIEETAERTGITRHTLRYYERIGLLAPVGRTVSGHRRYTDGDLGSIIFLMLLRETGMPIEDMQRFMALARQGEHTIRGRVDVLVAHRAELLSTLERLRGHLAALDHKIEVYTTALETTALETEKESV